MEMTETRQQLSKLQLLSVIGHTVFGEHWQKAMAEAVKVNQRTMGRWVNRDSPVPDEVPSTGTPLLVQLDYILRKHEAEVASVRAILNNYL